MRRCSALSSVRVLSVLVLAMSVAAPAAANVGETVVKICEPAWRAIDPDGDTFSDSSLAEAGLAAALKCEADGHPLGAASVANMLGRLGRYDEAAAAVERAMASGRELAVAYRERCTLEMDKGPSFEAAAVAACNEASRLAPDWYAPYMSRGFMHYRAQRYVEAEREWRAGLARQPNWAVLHQNLGLALAGQGRHAEALDEFAEAGRLAPRFSGPPINFARSLEALGRHDEALKVLNSAADEFGQEDTLLELGEFHQRRNNPARATEAYGRLLAKYPRNVAGLRARARMSESAGRYEVARSDYARVLEIEPRSVEAAMDVVRVISRGGLGDEALDAAHNYAIRITNELGTEEAGRTYRRGVARIARENKNWPALEQTSTRYIERFPNEVWGYAQRSTARRNLGKHQGSLEDETRILELDRDNPDSLFWRGGAHLALGNWAAAEADYSRLLSIRPKYLWAWNNRGKARAELGRMPEAYRDFEQFLALYEGRPHMSWVHWVAAGVESGVPLKTLKDVYVKRAPESDDEQVLTTYLVLRELENPGELRQLLEDIGSGLYDD